MIPLIGETSAQAGTPTPKPAGGSGSAKASSTTAATPAPAAPANPNATFGIRPATPNQVDSRVSYSYAMAPGGSYQDWAAIENFSTTPLDLLVYAADLDNASNGDLAVPAANVTPVEAGKWVTFPGAPITVHVPARGAGGVSQVLVPFSVKVPGNGSPGDHAAAIVVSLRTLGKNAKGENIQLDQRLAARLFIRVRGAIHARLGINNIKVHYNQTAMPLGRGSVTVSYVLQNTGNVKVGARQNVSVTGLFGTRAAGPPIPDQPLLLPGSQVIEHVTITGVLPTFIEHLHINAAVLQVAGSTDPTGRGATKDVEFSAIPWSAIICLLVLLFLLIGGFFGFRWWRARPAGGGRNGGRGGSPNDGPGPGPITPDEAPQPDPASERPPVGVSARVASRAKSGAAPVFALVVALLALVGLAPAASAAPTALSDPSAAGSIGLCSADGKAVTSGSVTARPFVALAASSVAAPAAFQGAGRKATLLAYQPRANVDASEWNGDTLTAASTYTNASKPMASATNQDFSLQDYLNEFPAIDNGMVQLRMYFGIPGQDTYSDSYPTTVLKISGNTWTIVGGGNVDCTGGQAVSSEVGALRATPTPVPGAKASVTASGSAAAGSGPAGSNVPGSTSGPSGATAAASSSSSSATTTAAAAKSSTSSSTAGWWIGGAVVVLAAAGGVVLWRRRLSAAG